jgi:Family of unknown function (DUF5989)
MIRNDPNAYFNDIENVRIRMGESTSILKEFWEFLKHSKRWWLLPIVLILGLLSVLIVMTESSAIFPMIYAIF